MIQVSQLYQELVDRGVVRAIRRYNLRKYCRALDLPPCGLSFWSVEDLNYDYLENLNRQLRHEKFRFQGGSNFPRAFWDDVVYGNQRRTEFIFLMTEPGQALSWRPLFQRCFAEQARTFGEEKWFKASAREQGSVIRAQIKLQLLLDFMHFSAKSDILGRLAEFHLGLYLLTYLEDSFGQTCDEILDRFKTQYPQFSGQLLRFKTTEDLEPRLDELLYFLNQAERECG